MANTHPETTLENMGIQLPDAPKPVASYIPARRSGNQIFISGQIPVAQGERLAQGHVPSRTSLEAATACARQCTLNGLACLKAEIGDLGRVTRVVKVGVFVASEPGFGDQPKIANGCSDLLVEVFGQDIGQHARAAVGVSSLPLDVPVEIEFIFEVEA
ncbi:MAG: RidA family protein [Phycisphaerales bacterium JB052]